jgi:hypothetical protein
MWSLLAFVALAITLFRMPVAGADAGVSGEAFDDLHREQGSALRFR